MLQRIFNDVKNNFYHLSQKKNSLKKSLEENNNSMLSKVTSGFKMINCETRPIVQVTQPLLFQEGYREYSTTMQQLKQLY